MTAHSSNRIQPALSPVTLRDVAPFRDTNWSNPPFHPEGDMAVNQGLAAMEGRKLNYAGIGIYHPRLFDVFDVGVKAKLFPWAFDFVRQGKVSAEHYRGRWENIGTPAQLAALDRSLDPGTGG